MAIEQATAAPVLECRDLRKSFGDRVAVHGVGFSHGYATEAAREALRFGFVEVGWMRSVSFTVPQDEALAAGDGALRPSGDFDHPRTDPVAFPHLVAHGLYRLHCVQWRASAR
jgi:hypothetical protein